MTHDYLAAFISLRRFHDFLNIPRIWPWARLPHGWRRWN